MPLDAWILLIVSVGLGLGLELVYMRARRRDRPGGERGVGGPRGTMRGRAGGRETDVRAAPEDRA